jgi:hypothetical protein
MAAPMAVPRRRFAEIFNAAPSEDCVTTRVVTAAQYVSGNRARRATSKEITAAAAVRTACATVGQPDQAVNAAHCGEFVHFGGSARLASGALPMAIFSLDNFSFCTIGYANTLGA